MESRPFETKAAVKEQLERCPAAMTIVNYSHDKIISRLPRELVSLVFRFCFPPVMLEGSPLTPFPSNFAKQVAARVLLGSVCTEWRRIAWSTPQLWTELGVSLNRIKDHQWHLMFVRDWLKRSGSLPLSLSITFPSSLEEGQKNINMTKNFVDEFNHVADRWHALQVDDPDSTHLHFFKASAYHEPILRTLAIGAYTYAKDARRFCPFETQLKPETVILEGLSIKAINVSWERVTSVRLCGCWAIECADVLSLAPNLQELGLRIGWSRRTVQSVEKILEHSNIRDLHITHSGHRNFDLVLGAAAFPGLVHLTLTGDLAIGPLSSFLSRSSCRLESLTINAPMLGGRGLLALLEHTPSITFLQVEPETSPYFMPGALLKRLAKTSIAPSSQDTAGGDHFLPNLRHLIYIDKLSYGPHNERKYIDWDGIFQAFGPLSEMANPRRRPLQTIEMYLTQGFAGHGQYSLDEGLKSSFLDVLDAGLDLKVRYIEDRSDVLTVAQDLFVGREDIACVSRETSPRL